MVCKKCGRNVKGDFKFCPYCGERLVSDFHDHYSELDPPFLVQEPDGPDTASDFYTYAPDEQEPDFGAFDDYDAYEQEMPHGRAADDDSYFVYQPQEPPPGLIFHAPDPDDLKEERPARSGRRFAEKRAGTGVQAVFNPLDFGVGRGRHNFWILSAAFSCAV